MAIGERRSTPWLTLGFLRSFDGLALLALRLATGIFLIDGVWDNMTDPKRMQEFIDFMKGFGFRSPEFWAPFSVYSQFLAGILLIPGLLTRWAGAIVTITFIVALWMVHWDQALREWWPALALVTIGLVLMTRGAGRFAIDTAIEHRAAS